MRTFVAQPNVHVYVDLTSPAPYLRGAPEWQIAYLENRVALCTESLRPSMDQDEVVAYAERQALRLGCDSACVEWY